MQSICLSVRILKVSTNGPGITGKVVKWLFSAVSLKAAWQGLLRKSRFSVDLLSSFFGGESATPSSWERGNTSLLRKDGCCLGRPYVPASVREDECLCVWQKKSKWPVLSFACIDFKLNYSMTLVEFRSDSLRLEYFMLFWYECYTSGVGSVVSIYMNSVQCRCQSLVQRLNLKAVLLYSPRWLPNESSLAFIVMFRGFVIQVRNFLFFFKFAQQGF